MDSLVLKQKDGFYGTDRDRNLGLIEKLNGYSDRSCECITAIALVNVEKNISIVKSHILKGTVATTVRGENGFGFDEIFVLENGKTIAELSPEEKNSLTPRKYALEAIRKELI